EVDLDTKQSVLAALTPRPRPARPGGATEEGFEDVAEPAEVAESLLGSGIVLLSLLRVAEHVVRVRHELEPLCRVGAGVDIRVQLTGKPPIRTLDVIGRSVAVDAQH